MYDEWAFMVTQVNSITNLLELKYSEIRKYVEFLCGNKIPTRCNR